MKKLALLSVGLLICLVGVFSVKNYIENYVSTEIESAELERKSESFLKQIQSTESKFNPSFSEYPDFREIANNSINTVVHVKSSSSPENNFSIEDFLFGGADNGPKIGSGSGVIISSDGYIVTNYHVIENAQKISITTNNNQNYEADIVGYDEQNDIALLKIESENSFPFAIFGDSDASMIGEWVLAVGNPFNLTSTVTAGIISAKSRSLDPTGRTTQSYIQTDAAVNPGNSGGALVNENGELVGITSKIFSTTGSFSGISFALPVDKLSDIASEIIKFGVARKASLGNFSIRSIRILHNNQLKYCGEIVNYSSGPILDLFKRHERLCILKINEEPMNLDRLRLVLENAFPGDEINLTLLDDRGELHYYKIKTESI